MHVGTHVESRGVLPRGLPARGGAGHPGLPPGQQRADPDRARRLAREARGSFGVASRLGAERAEDVLHALERLRVIEGGPQERVDLNHDLYPRDEFLAP